MAKTRTLARGRYATMCFAGAVSAGLAAHAFAGDKWIQKPDVIVYFEPYWWENAWYDSDGELTSPAAGSADNAHIMGSTGPFGSTYVNRVHYDGSAQQASINH